MSLASEFLRAGVAAGLVIAGDAGVEKTWLALREEKGKREPVAGEGDGGCSSSGLGGAEWRTGDGERRPGNAERSLDALDMRLVGRGA